MMPRCRLVGIRSCCCSNLRCQPQHHTTPVFHESWTSAAHQLMYVGRTAFGILGARGACGVPDAGVGVVVALALGNIKNERAIASAASTSDGHASEYLLACIVNDAPSCSELQHSRPRCAVVPHANANVPTPTCPAQSSQVVAWSHGCACDAVASSTVASTAARPCMMSDKRDDRLVPQTGLGVFVYLSYFFGVCQVCILQDEPHATN